MKNNTLLIFIILLACGYITSGQSLSITAADTTVFGNASSDGDISGDITVTNTSNSAAKYIAKRIDKNYNSLTDSNAICWGICYIPSVSVAPSEEIKAKESFTGNFHVYPDMDGNPQQGPIRYVIYNEADPTDSVSFTMNFQVTTDFSVNEIPERPTLTVFPNPAKDRLSVSYDLKGANDGSFELVSVLGKKVFSKNLQQENGEFELNLRNLSRGVYFYNLKTSGQTVSTRRLIVQ